jgi:hypothetical protein
MVAGMATAAASTAMLPPHTTAVVTKTPVAAVMAEAQTTINNQLKVAAATETKTMTMTATMMTMKTKAAAVAAAAAAWQQCGC